MQNDPAAGQLLRLACTYYFSGGDGTNGITLCLPNGQQYYCGRRRTKPDDRTPTLRFTTWAAVRAVIRNPALGLFDGYANGRIIVTDGHMAELAERIVACRRGIPALRRLFYLHGRVSNAIGRQGANIANHYDVGIGYYRLIFSGDPTWSYTCADWTRPDMTLAEAQHAKLDTILGLAGIDKARRLLDIGFGFGGLLRAAVQRNPGLEAVGISLSQDQVAQAGVLDAEQLTDEELARVQHRLLGYQAMAEQVRRGLAPAFGHLVSVGMYEAVGPKDQARFWRDMFDLATADATMVLHTIVKYQPGVSGSWIHRIFPGGYLPTPEEVIHHATAAGWQVHQVIEHGPHYVPTLQAWLNRHVEHKDTIIDRWGKRFWLERYCWYLLCIAAFRHRVIGVRRFVLTKGQAGAPAAA